MKKIEREKKDLEKAIKKIEKDGTSEILELAAKNICSGCDTVIHYDPAGDDFSAAMWGGNTYLNPESRLVEVYRVDGNFIGNANLEIGDIVSDEEYEELREAVAKEQKLTDEYDIDYVVDFCDPAQLDLIGIDFSERLETYFSWCQDGMHSDSQIPGCLKRELAEYY